MSGWRRVVMMGTVAHPLLIWLIIVLLVWDGLYSPIHEPARKSRTIVSRPEHALTLAYSLGRKSHQSGHNTPDKRTVDGHPFL